jgi:anti-sigma B factor antagonist
MEETYIKITYINQITVIELPARIDTLTANKISPEVVQITEQKSEGILFNLRDVTFVSSAGIRIFLSAYKKCESHSIKIAMVNVHPSVYKIFKVAGMDKFFNIFNNESEALKNVWAMEQSS